MFFLCALTNVRAQDTEEGDIDQVEASSPSENVILQWNRVLMETLRTPGVHPGATIFPLRSYAMMHAAMFDAVNSIDKTYTPYLIEVPAARRASIDAAAAQAAHDVLVGLYPSRRDVYATELANSLQGIPPRRAGLGIEVGRIVAERMLAFRSNDGWTVTPPPYVLPPTPGNWQPTPPANAIATFTHAPGVKPFALMSTSQFSPPPPPELTSVEYAIDFNEVKEIGAVNSTRRTAVQTLIAQLWHGVNTPTTLFFVWNSVARNVAISRGNTTVENARLFALFNIAVHDALITSFTAKFKYGLWRPVTAIRRADEDGNPDTEPDAGWLALIGNPPYPAYPGNMAAVGMAHATTLALVFGRDDIRFQNTWEGTPSEGRTRSYLSFGQMANEEANSRIYGGIHFRFDNEAGLSIGRNVANYVFLNFMRPRRCDGTTPTLCGWAKCADEGGRCDFDGTRRVRYGANGVYVYATFTDGARCSNDVFGDPLYGVAKSCEVQR